jgi:hypothetical protein
MTKPLVDMGIICCFIWFSSDIRGWMDLDTFQEVGWTKSFRGYAKSEYTKISLGGLNMLPVQM